MECPYVKTITDEASGVVVSNPLYKAWQEGAAIKEWTSDDCEIDDCQNCGDNCADCYMEDGKKSRYISPDAYERLEDR